MRKAMGVGNQKLPNFLVCRSRFAASSTRESSTCMEGELECTVFGQLSSVDPVMKQADWDTRAMFCS